MVARGGQICRKQICCAQRPERSEGKGHGRPAANRTTDTRIFRPNVRIWTPPHLQAICIWQTWYDCIRISGLFSWHTFTDAGPKWFIRAPAPNRFVVLMSTWTLPGLADAGLTCLPSCSLLKQSSLEGLLIDPVSANRILRIVIGFMAQHGPGHAAVLLANATAATFGCRFVAMSAQRQSR